MVIVSPPRLEPPVGKLLMNGFSVLSSFVRLDEAIAVAVPPLTAASTSIDAVSDAFRATRISMSYFVPAVRVIAPVTKVPLINTR